MSDFKRYRDLDIWKKSFTLSLMIFDLCKKIKYDSINRVLINQIVRSVTSIAGNIAEGSGAVTKRDFINYLQTARKSTIETDNWLIFIFSSNKIQKKSQELLKGKSEEIIKILTTIIKNSKH
ncbi:MAG: four helix bundle protein [Patescibacteria group bacterium]|jgi:four helix bundle protein